MESIVAPSQYITVALFLAVMFAVLYFVRRYQKPLSAKLSAHTRIKVTSATAIGPQARAVILDVDGAEYLTILTKNGTAQLSPLPAKAQEDETCA